MILEFSKARNSKQQHHHRHQRHQNYHHHHNNLLFVSCYFYHPFKESYLSTSFFNITCTCTGKMANTGLNKVMFSQFCN